jgi:hypothetical protein
MQPASMPHSRASLTCRPAAGGDQLAPGPAASTCSGELRWGALLRPPSWRPPPPLNPSCSLLPSPARSSRRTVRPGGRPPALQPPLQAAATPSREAFWGARTAGGRSCRRGWAEHTYITGVPPLDPTALLGHQPADVKLSHHQTILPTCPVRLNSTGIARHEAPHTPPVFSSYLNGFLQPISMARGPAQLTCWPAAGGGQLVPATPTPQRLANDSSLHPLTP